MELWNLNVVSFLLLFGKYQETFTYVVLIFKYVYVKCCLYHIPEHTSSQAYDRYSCSAIEVSIRLEEML
jgi:hypothetical protein